MTDLRGLGTALITPFASDGSVDFEALKRLLDKQLAGGVDYIVVLGTTGEAVTLTEAERLAVRRTVIEHVKGQIPLVLGVGGNNTAAVCETLRKDDLTGFSAILSVCPYYNKPSQEGLFRHFCAVAEASPLPVILYNVPGRTGVNLLPETVMRIYYAAPQKILGVKEASGNLNQIRYLIGLAKGTPLLVISGDDGITAQIMQAGGAGLISVLSNAYPKEARRIVHEADQQLQTELAPLIELLFKEGNPAGIKTVLAQQGVIANVLRLPLVPNSEAVQSAINTFRIQNMREV
ncbi:MAG: 4-hydroxy-tetrahydrodipicolinate synthase [Paludibacteraceae bacterium]|nr:4-hydroxy-tetrahydrodipicolinate synthase [Paludibacteraceae bacterium]